MKRPRASVVFPPGLPEAVKSSLRDFIVRRNTWAHFEFRDDPAFQEPAVESLEVAPESCGSIDGSKESSVGASAASLHEDLLREHYRIQRLTDPQGP